MTTGTQSSLVSPQQSEGVTLKKSDQSQKEIETDGKSDKRGGREEEKKKNTRAFTRKHNDIQENRTYCVSLTLQTEHTPRTRS